MSTVLQFQDSSLSVRVLLLGKMLLSPRADVLRATITLFGGYNLIVFEPVHSLSLVAPQVEELTFSLFPNEKGGIWDLVFILFFAFS